MKRSGFTMVELIFVIVIIGILAATALPKFKDVSKNANVANFTKIIGDIESGAVAAFTNETQLRGNKDIKIQDILTINGKGWTLEDDTIASNDDLTNYKYEDSVSDINATVTLNNGRQNSDANITVVISAGSGSVADSIVTNFNLDSTTRKGTRVYTLDN